MTCFRKYNLVVGWLAFAVAALTYLLTIEPTTSLWDCAEFIATSYKLEVGHPPGAPLFMMIARLFAMLGGQEHGAMMINAMSGLCSAFTILFLFWTITHLGRRLLRVDEGSMSAGQVWGVLGAGLVGALSFTFTDTFWFSAVEGEVYAMSSLFTAAVFWAMLRWEEVADRPHNVRWLILIAYLMGLSIGVHILNLLCIPALVLIYYFKKSAKVTSWGVIKALAVSGAILIAINAIIIPATTLFGAWIDRMFNAAGAPVNVGFTIYAAALFALVIWGIWLTHKRGKVLANTILLCFGVILLGYSSYASVVIRASANPPMNSNNPSDPYALYSLLSRDQYGSKPVLTGPYYSSPAIDNAYKTDYYVGDDGRYVRYPKNVGAEFAPGFDSYLFPRMWDAASVEGYRSWVAGADGDIPSQRQTYNGQIVEVPTMGANIQYFFSLQLGHMFLRYFFWNFVGRQDDIQSTGEITHGNWLSGIGFIDAARLGPQENLPDEMRDNKARNTYYFLPFILGLLGLVYQLNRDAKNFSVVALLFFLTGIALVVYLNGKPVEPRERDYVYAGAFYAFAIWIGLGVMWLWEALSKAFKKQNVVAAIAATALCSCVPILLAAQNWDDHDRSHRYVARDIGYNYLSSTLPNAIIVDYGDNDTFPLWYAQEVESVRPDVRIMNMMYLSSDWYTDQMRVRSNESAPVPFSLPRGKYVGEHNSLPVHDDPRFAGLTITARQVMDFVASDNPASQVTLTDGRKVDYIPARRLALPVNKTNAVKSGIVRAEEAALMADTLWITLPGNQLHRHEFMFLDLLASFDWARPLHFTSIAELSRWGLRDYVQFDGFSYRLVPIATPGGTYMGTGRIDIDYLEHNLMEVFRYGNIKDPRVYVDYFCNYNLSVAQVRNAYARLAKELVARGDSVRAIEVLDYGMAELPTGQLRHDYMTTYPVIEAYYLAGADERGDALMGDYAENLRQYIDYFLQFEGGHAALVQGELDERVQYLIQLYNLSYTHRRPEMSARIEQVLNRVPGIRGE